MQTGKLTLASITGVIGSFIVNLLGGWTSDLQTLVIFMGIDFVMGLALATFFKSSPKSDTGTLNSTSAWEGICKKCGTLAMVLVANQLDVTFDMSYVRTAVIITFIVVELISIVENAGLMGIPVPKVILNVIDVLKERTGEDDENLK